MLTEVNAAQLSGLYTGTGADIALSHLCRHVSGFIAEQDDLHCAPLPLLAALTRLS